jgi:hypothetical protein
MVRPYQETFVNIAARAVAALAASLAVTTYAADRLEIPGATSAFYILKPYAERIREASAVDFTIAPVGNSQAVLDVMEGRADAAIVTTSLVDAVAGARILAWTDSHRLVTGRQLTYVQLPALDPTGRPLGVVAAKSSPELQRVVNFLMSRSSMVAAVAQ